MNHNSGKILVGNHRLLKNLNSNTVLNLVRTKAPISGADLAKITGMRPSTVQNILKNLEKEGMVSRIGIGSSTKLGGRKPILWKICGNYGYVVGIQLEINEIQAVLVDLNSQLIAEKKIKIKRFNSLSDIDRKVIEIIDDVLDMKKIMRHQLLGIGVGVSGLVDISDGVIIKTSLLPPSQQPIHLERSLKQYFDIPIYVENDANAAALAEKWFGKANGYNHIVFTLVMIDRDVFGVGFGLILDNDIYRGANMFAGETNSFTINIQKILRDYCHFYDDHLLIGDQSVSINELEIHHLIKACELENEIAIRFFKDTGEIIGKELLSVLNLLDPSLIIIGGEIAKAKDFILDPIRETLKNGYTLGVERKFQLLESSLPDYSVALGTATIILQNIFQEPLSTSI
ncbi:ROK family transcriptional regulator [candidate division KSB1 bacterium]|nr:ROK family transcriptional regulator [candidate division KSB1 bacterium]